MKARKSAAPYSAQLKRYLGQLDGPAVFSAAVLEKEFDLRPRENRRTTINSIHQALRREWEAGNLVAFISPEGSELREAAFGVSGSSAVEHPQIFGTPDAASPDPDYTAASYTDYLALAHAHTGRNGVDAAAADDSGETEHDSEGESGDDVLEAPSSEADAGISVQEAKARISEFHITEPAPEWMPSRLLAHLVTLPEATRVLRMGLDQAHGKERLQLIRAGIRRKGEVDSLTAGKLGQLCRSESIWWARVFDAAVAQYLKWDEAVADADLPALAAAPDEFYLAHEERYAPEVVVLCGMMLGADPEALADVAEVAADALEDEEVEQAIGVEERLRHRAGALEAEIADLRRQVAEAHDAERKQRARAESLEADLARAQGAAREAGSMDDRLKASEKRASHLAQELAEVRSELETANAAAERTGELEERLTILEHERDELSVSAEAAREERARRQKAEVQLQEQAGELRRLEDELRAAQASGVLVPIDDPRALLRVLARPIGEAAALAAKRLAAGQADPNDARLLTFSANFGELAAAVGEQREESTEETSAADGAGVTEGPERPVEPVEAVEPHAEATTAKPEEHTTSSATPADSARTRRRRRSTLFTVIPVGGAGEVGGSAVVVQTRAGDSLLLDAGQRVKGEYGLDGLAPFHYTLPGVEHLDAIVISHAHIDHVGSLPVLHEHYQRRSDASVPIYMSGPTKALAEVMLRDSAKIQHKTEYLASGAMAELARSDFRPDLDLRPAYDESKINAALDAVVPTEPYQPYRVPSTDGRVTIKLIPVAHVLGSCAVHLTDNETGATLLYTGDLGPFTEPQRTLQPLGLDTFDPADVVITESTYARLTDAELEGRRTSGREEALDELFKAARRAHADGGHVLLPAFSLGRTHEILQIIEDYSIEGEMPKGEVFIGGMGEQIVRLYSDHRGSAWSVDRQMSRADELHRSLRIDRTRGGHDKLEEVVEERVSSEAFSYFIVSPAMLSGGWSRAFLRCMVDEERHAVIFTGYMPRHAGNIRNFARKHTGATIRFDEDGWQTEIRCAWRQSMLSAHAPARDLHAFAKRMLKGDKEVVFGAVHGQPEAQQALATYIDQLEGASAVSLENGLAWNPQRG